MEKKEVENAKENSKLHERVGELLRSNVELADNLKNTAPAANAPNQSRPCKFIEPQ